MSCRSSTSRRWGPLTGCDVARSGVPAGDSGRRRDTGRSAVVVVVVVAVVAVVVLAVWVVSRDGEPSDGATVSRGLSLILDDVEYESGVADLDECPVIETDVLLAAVGAQAEIDPAVAEGDQSIVAYQETATFPAGVFCNVFAVDDAPLTRGAVAVSLSVTMTPLGDYDDFLLGAFDNETTDLGGLVDFRGGQVHPYCLAAADEQGQTGCGADWVHDEAQVAVGVYLAGERDEAVAVSAVKAVLPEVVEALGTGD